MIKFHSISVGVAEYRKMMKSGRKYMRYLVEVSSEEHALEIEKQAEGMSGIEFVEAFDADKELCFVGG